MAAFEFNAALKIADQTLAAIEAAVAANAEDWRRPHLGASVIGRSCTAAIWWSFRWASDPGHKPRMLRLFARGQREEDSLCRLLRAAGVNVVQVDPNTGDQYRFSDGHFGGSMDGAAIGVPEAPKTWHLVEMKTAGRKAFDQLEKVGVKAAKPEHYAQMQCYMAWTGMTRALYVTVCKDDDRLHLERIDFDKSVAEKHLQRAQDVIASDVPMEKLSEDPTWYECKWCEHHALCHGNHAPLVSCRTCTHITFRRDGTTHCGRHDQLLPIDVQRTGCEQHRFNPAMLRNWATAVDASEKDNWVRYHVPAIDVDIVNGSGEGHFTSEEFRAIARNPEVVNDRRLMNLRADFDGRLVAQ